jgi:acyl-[acyl-carrier-protein]-phospholipid O-acyltransferase/long-chain-fatty-acid--[acyl-carrier-protein] ligase
MDFNPLHLLRLRRFLPLFITQFLGAMNDNLFKQALVVLIAFRLAPSMGLDGGIMVTAAAGIFILPFFLFSATAGQLADKFEKSRTLQIVKSCEIAIMGLAVIGFYLEEPFFLIAVLFLMGTQSAFFGPAKYSILPDHLEDRELVAGNALVESGTLLAILFGTIAGGLMILSDNGAALVSTSVVVLAVLGWLASRWIPAAGPAAPDLKINYNMATETLALIRYAAGQRTVFLSMLGISWFWLLGAVFLAQVPNFAKDVLGADETVVTMIMAIFSVGIGIGAIVCNRMLRGEISARYVPYAALAITVFLFDLYLANATMHASGGPLIDAGTFIKDPQNWRILIDLLLFSVAGGIYSVPLYSVVQHESAPAHRSRVIAANNVLNAAFLVGGTVIATLLLAQGQSIPQIFKWLAVGNFFAALYIMRLLPETVIKAIVALAVKLIWRIEVRGIENYAKAGPRAVIIVNHVSFLDGMLLAALLPGKPNFAIDTYIAKEWWVKPFISLIDIFPIDPTNPLATKHLINHLREDHHCVIFPEGRITVTGALMKIFDGPAMIADKSDATLIPVRIDGAERTPFSRMKGKMPLRWFPKITLTILPPKRLDIPEGQVGRVRRQSASQALYRVMSDMMFETSPIEQTLTSALVRAADEHGAKKIILDDLDRRRLSYKRLILGAQVLGRPLARMSEPKEIVGVLLPTSAGAAVTFFALHAQGRVPAMLNFGTGARNMLAAIDAAQIKTILTSRRFIEAAKFGETIDALARKARVVYLEDLREEIGIADKLCGLWAARHPTRIADDLGVKPDDPAVVLFTSGSEGTPKGVVLSHKNLLANRYQLANRLDVHPADVVFNALPIFHSFGLTGGLLLPLLMGVRTFLYPSPLHYRTIPTLVYDLNATILFGTDTFLAGYGRRAHAYDFYSVRYVFAGAEKLRADTRAMWFEKFGIRIMEGYGATETAPVLSVNTPMQYKAGTVGRFLPGISYRLDPVEGIEQGGRLVVSGPSVMLGYLLAEDPGIIQPPKNGEYDTGDIVDVDEQGFISILGRAKRFAKIAGEMVSLAAVENCAADLWPDAMHAVIAIPDQRKGEQLVLITDHAKAERRAIIDYARQHGIADLMVPRTVQIVDKVPVLGTGKIDYQSLEKSIRGAG